MPPITEAKLFEAFGLDPTKAPGVQEQEPAAPAAEPTVTDTDEGARVQEPAAPAAVTEEPETEPQTEPAAPEAADNGDDGAEPGKQPLTPEQRKANAARRRAQEQQAAVDQAVQAAVQAERERSAQAQKDFFAQAGLMDTFTGKPITSMEEFQSWKQRYDTEQAQKKLKEGQLTPEILNNLISNHPDVQQARQVVQQNQAAQVQQREAAEQTRINDQLAKISELNPEIKGLADILAMETAPQFREYVAKGYDFLDSYKLANMDALAEAKAERARNQALNNARGKEHLNATGNARGSGAASVPPDQMRLFRSLNPGATDAQIQAFYNKYKSSQGG